MLKIWRTQERSHSSHGWSDSHHTFSFDSCCAPDAMGFPGLPVINDDTVAPGGGFAADDHEDMEVICYLLEKGLEQRDRLGGASLMRSGDMQRVRTSASPGGRP